MKDTIYREDAIKSMAKAIWHYPNELYLCLNSYEHAHDLAEQGLKFLPSAEQKKELLNSYCHGCVNDNSDFTPICAECCRAYPDQYSRRNDSCSKGVKKNVGKSNKSNHE